MISKPTRIVPLSPLLRPMDVFQHTAHCFASSRFSFDSLLGFLVSFVATRWNGTKKRRSIWFARRERIARYAACSVKNVINIITHNVLIPSESLGYFCLRNLLRFLLSWCLRVYPYNVSARNRIYIQICFTNTLNIFYIEKSAYESYLSKRLFDEFLIFPAIIFSN